MPLSEAQLAVLERSRQRQHSTARTHYEKQEGVSKRLQEMSLKQEGVSKRLQETYDKDFAAEGRFQRRVLFGNAPEDGVGVEEGLL